MGALASVVVSSSRCAVSGSHPDCLSLAPPACCPRPVRLLPSGFGRCSANNGENKYLSNQILGLFEGWLYSSHWNCNSRCSIDKDTQLKVYFMHFLSPLQDRVGQKHAVEVLKEELEEGRWASFTFSPKLEIKKKSC